MNTEILATSEHPSVHGYRTIQLPRIVGKIRKREESMRNNSVHTGLENVPFQIGDHFPQITVDSHRISLFGLFRKEGRRRRAKREGEEGGFTSHSAKIIWQSVPKAGVARAGAPSDSTTGMRGSFRTRCCRWRISGRGVGSRPYSTVCNARPLSKYRSQFSPAKWIVETGPVPPHQFSVTIVTLFRCLVETC